MGEAVRERLLAAGLPNLWIPKADDIRIIDALPLLGTGKLDLPAIKRMATNQAVFRTASA